MIECSQFWEANQIVENVLRNTDRIAVGLCGHIPSGAEASGNIVDMENLLMHQTVQMSRVDFSPAVTVETAGHLDPPFCGRWLRYRCTRFASKMHLCWDLSCFQSRLS